MVPNESQPETKRIRLLLDQGFPKPPGFALRAVDAMTEATHLSDFDRGLSLHSTPDWYLYCRAAESNFNALVTRDLSQIRLAPEMFVLSRLERFAVICWHKPIEDPMVEWGQLIAYLPQIKKRLQDNKKSMIILLPKPSLASSSMRDPGNILGEMSSGLDISNEQVRHDAKEEIVDWLSQRGEVERFSRLLRI